MRDTTGLKNAGFLRHDRMIVANELRFALASWSDRLIALVIPVVALAAVRSSLSQRPFIFAAIAVAALATAIGAWAERMIERRVNFHSQDGVLAAQALAEDAKRHYALSIHALVCAIVMVCAVIGRPAVSVFAPVGYLIGAGICYVVCRVVPTRASPRRSFSVRSIKRVLQRPISGAMAGMLAILPLLLLRSLEHGRMETIVGLVSVVAALLLTMLDYNVIRFMTESGYAVGRIIGIHARSLLIFLILTVATSLVLSDSLVAIVIFGIVLTALMFMTIRILAYRIYSKRAADTLVSICAGIASLTAVAMPIVVPVVVIAIFWQLHKRAVRVTWLLT